MGTTTYLRLNIQICGVNQNNTQLINNIFPTELERNKRELIRKEDNIRYTARIFSGTISQQNNLNIIKDYINNNFDHIQYNKKEFPKNIVLCFSDENSTLQQNIQNFIRVANTINTLPELKIPFIAFLTYEDINQIRQQVYQENGDIFGNFQDKRKIIILRLTRNDNEVNKRKILSFLWEMTLILNQKPFILSKTPEANFYRIREESPLSTINILLCGFTRKGKSTFINMVFDKMVTLENPSFLPVTSEIIELLLPSQPDENGLVKGGLKFIDVPGLIEGTTENKKNIIKLIDKSIQNQEFNFDVINYILFFLSPAPNFQNTRDFLRKLNNSNIKVIFIINRDRPRDDGSPNTTKQTLIDHLKSLGFNNLIINGGNNILEVDLINGVNGRINEIFRYMYNDFTRNNRFNDNEIINNLRTIQEANLFPYLHNNFEIFSRINSTEDLIERGSRRADIIASVTIPLIIATGFSPIPFIDVPIFLILIAIMLIKIFKAYGFRIDNNIITNFFRNYNRENQANNNNNNNNNNNINNNVRMGNLMGRLSQIFGEIQDRYTRFIIEKLIIALSLRIGFSTALGILDFIPGGFIIAGVINLVINIPFIHSIKKSAKKFLGNEIRNNGARQNVLNIIESYKDSTSLLEDLNNRNDWTRKLQIFDSQ